MDFQTILLVVSFIAAVIYVGRIIYRAIAPKNNGCATGCGKCAANFDHIPTTKN